MRLAVVQAEFFEQLTVKISVPSNNITDQLIINKLSLFYFPFQIKDGVTVSVISDGD